MLTAAQVLKQVESLREYLAMKASEEMDSMPAEGGEMPTEAAPEGMGATEGGEGGGMGVLLSMKPKGEPPGAAGGKVPGCPDCADGTPHEHVDGKETP